MAIITFTSDFGTQDHYVAAVKARIFNYNPNIQVIDISHNVPKHNMPHAVFILNSVFRDFPKGTVHLLAVNRPFMKHNRYLAVKVEEHYFVGYDNGFLSLLTDKTPLIIELPSDKQVETTFPEKSILAFAAVALANGKNIYDLGNTVPVNSIYSLFNRKLKMTTDHLEGNIIHIDSFGNAITNISKTAFNQFAEGAKVTVYIKRYTFEKIVTDYAQEEEGEGFLVFNDQGLLEIGIVCGNAAQLMGLKYDDVVLIEKNSSGNRY